jgi:cytosine/adenosine deaminase-related metal-dependent hydrolase
MTVIYCARWVVPVSATPVEDGAVVVEGEQILSVGLRAPLLEQFPAARIESFPEGVILPGFINAHSHLELTSMRGFLDGEEGDFMAWLRKLTLARLERMTADDLYVSAAWGACEAARAGVTCVGDGSSAALQSMTALRDVGLRGTVFQESFGPDPRLAAENLAALRTQIVDLRKLENSRLRAGVSPHAPYTVSASQLKLISDFALSEQLPVMMHAAESSAEDLLLRQGTGVFADGLAARGIEWKAESTSPIRYLNQTGVLATRPLLAHCVNVDEGDIRLMAASGSRVAHCPKSNARLGHGRAPLLEFLRNGVQVGLGSDSVASNNTCDLLEEARFAMLLSRLEATGEPLSSAAAINLATAGGARALELGTRTGELQPALQADLAILSLSGVHQQPSYDPLSTLLNCSGGRDVVMTVVGGREVFCKGRVTTVDEEDLRERVAQVARKLSG